jgi:hypothetical protein
LPRNRTAHTFTVSLHKAKFNKNAGGADAQT